MAIRLQIVIAILMLTGSGCSKPEKAAPKAHLRPEVKVVNVEKRTIVRSTEQPGFIEAYEQTSIYPKVAGFIDKWNVDIGDSITEGRVLAHLDVPDLIAKYEEKKAEVALDEVRITVAEEFVKVAKENLQTASAQVKVARANLGTFEAEVAFTKSDFDRIDLLVKDKAVDKVLWDVKRKARDTSIASLEAAKAGVEVAEAAERARKADVDKAQVDVEAARGKSKVSQATEKRLAAMVGYTYIRAPYDGIVIARNVNKGDFAQPAAGDPSAQRDNPAATRASSSPLYVVARIDKVRIFLDVPEMEANGIQPGSQAHVKIEAVDNMAFPAEVTRTSWALNAKSRTLRAEIDIDNPMATNPYPNKALPVLGARILGLMGSQLLGQGPVLASSALIAGSPATGRILPNMYAYGRVELKRVDVWAIPLQSVFQLGNQNYCYVLEDGKAVKLPVQLGIDDGNWVEVVKKHSGGKWVPCGGKERIVVGELSQLSDSEPVRQELSATPRIETPWLGRSPGCP
jgi:multidrug efflux pump subunit AcrA (membrane-fusion protein)